MLNHDMSLVCCNHMFWETNWPRRTMQIVECSYYTRGPKAESPLSHGPRSVFVQFSSVQFSCSVMSDSLKFHESQCTGLPVHHQLLEFTQTHAHRVSDAIQPSHPLLSPSPPAPNPSQHQGLFQWVNSLHEVAKELEFQLQHQSFQWIPRTDLL